MARPFQCELVPWRRVTSLTRRLAQRITAAGFAPDLIVAIARGGYVPGRLLADYLDVMDLVSIRVEHYTAGAHKRRQARVVQPLNIVLAGRRVLIVDDVADTGDTFVLARAHVAARHPAAVRTAALHFKTSSGFEPDFFAERLTAWRWINYPWARIEDIAGFIARLRPRPTTVTAATRRLDHEFGLRAPRALVEDAMYFAQAWRGRRRRRG
jgi:hypoxanthine phosphoribosyltransferase